MANGHRSQIKRERNAVKDTRPSAKLSYARVSVQKACFVLDAIGVYGVYSCSITKIFNIFKDFTERISRAPHGTIKK